MAIKLPHKLGVCQKTVGNSAGIFTGVVREKHRYPGFGRQLNLRLPPVNGENHFSQTQFVHSGVRFPHNDVTR